MDTIYSPIKSGVPVKLNNLSYCTYCQLQICCSHTSGPWPRMGSGEMGPLPSGVVISCICRFLDIGSARAPKRYKMAGGVESVAQGTYLVFLNYSYISATNNSVH